MRKMLDPQILTANRLQTGDVLYWARGNWIEDFGSADIFAAVIDAEQALTRAQKFVADRIVVNPYLFPVRIEAGEMLPLEERERIRAAGPSVRGAAGKQAHSRLTPHV